jgi:hypothetical protein
LRQLDEAVHGTGEVAGALAAVLEQPEWEVRLRRIGEEPLTTDASAVTETSVQLVLKLVFDVGAGAPGR